MRRIGAAVVVALAALGLASPAAEAAPNSILVSGPSIAHPRLLGDWNENLRLLLFVADAPRARGAHVAGLARRPSLDLAEFWAWGGRPRPTTARSRPIRITVDGVTAPRLVPASVRAILARHGVPARL